MLGRVRITGPSLDNLIVQISNKHGVDPALTKAVISTESSFDVNARRYEPHLKDSSLGLMQLLTKTAKWMLKKSDLSESELLRPDVNIEAGVRYLKYQLNRYKNNIKHAILSYNAGSVRRKKDGSYINEQYLNKVWPRYLAYKGLGAVGGTTGAFAIAAGVGVGVFLLMRK